MKERYMETSKGGRPKGRFLFRIRGEAVSSHAQQGVAEMKLRRHNQSPHTQGTALYGDVIEVTADGHPVRICHDTGDYFEWSDIV
jgi:hypothetical protein